MKQSLTNLWHDDCGALLATEWVIIATIIVIGIIPGLIAVRQGTLAELTDFANATLSLDQSYSFTGQELRWGCDERGRNHDEVRGDASHEGFASDAKVDVRHDDVMGQDVAGVADNGGRNWDHRGAMASTAGSAFQQKGCDKNVRMGAVEPECVGVAQKGACD
jgi:hypothetical protein